MSFLRTFAHIFHPQRSNNYRARILHAPALLQLSGFATLFVLSVHLLSTTQTPVGLVLGYATNITAEEVVQLINTQRSQIGLEPLSISSELSQAALAKGQNMFSEQYWAHVSPSGKEPWEFIRNSGYSYSVAGENLARDFMQSDNMVEAWMNSSTHRANIVSSEYEETGVAVINGELKGMETTLVVQLFGRPKSSVITKSGIVPQAQAESAAVGGLGQANYSGTVAVETTFTNHQSGLSPLDLTKAVFVSLLLVLLAALVYDTIVISKKRVARTVGKNFGHIMLYLVVAALIIFFKGGVIG